MKEDKNISSSEVPGKFGSEGRLDEFFRSFKHFGLRARQELKRAERYCDYLSCLTITMTGGGKVSEAKDCLSYRSREAMLGGLRQLIKRSVRQTDILSGFEEDRIALLLVETPKRGARALSKRLQENIRDFLSSEAASQENWKVSFTVVSFPDDTDTKEDFLAHLDSLASGGET